MRSVEVRAPLPLLLDKPGAELNGRYRAASNPGDVSREPPRRLSRPCLKYGGPNNRHFGDSYIAKAFERRQTVRH